MLVPVPAVHLPRGNNLRRSQSRRNQARLDDSKRSRNFRFRRVCPISSYLFGRRGKEPTNTASRAFVSGELSRRSAIQRDCRQKRASACRSWYMLIRNRSLSSRVAPCPIQASLYALVQDTERSNFRPISLALLKRVPIRGSIRAGGIVLSQLFRICSFRLCFGLPHTRFFCPSMPIP